MSSKSSDARLKLLGKDRKTFLRFCKFAHVQDADLLFESASAKEVPIDLEELIGNSRQLAEANKAVEDLREFSALVFDDSSIDRLDIKSLRERWMSRKDESGERSVLTLMTVQDQIRQQAVLIQELEQQLRERSRKGDLDACTQTNDKKFKGAHAQTNPVETQIAEDRSHEFENKAKQLEAEVIAKDEKIISMLSEIRSLKDQKSVVESKLASLEKERNKFNFVETLALKQAERDAEVARLHDEIHSLKSAQTSPVPAPVVESSDLRKNIFVKFVSYAIMNDYDKMKSLIPIATELFHLTRDDVEELSKACTTDGTWISSFLKI